MSSTSSALLSLVSLTFVICSLFTFVGKNLVVGGWTADTTQISPLRYLTVRYRNDNTLKGDNFTLHHVCSQEPRDLD